MSAGPRGDVRDPRVSAEGSVEFGSGRFKIRTADLRSTFATGNISGEGAGGRISLQAELTYVPEKLGVVVSPWMDPSWRLEGVDARRVTASYQGPWEPEKGSGVFQGELGRLTGFGFGMDAEAKGALDAGRLRLEGPVTVNGGSGSATVEIDTAGPTGTFTASGRDIALGAENGGALSFLHPIFADSARLDGKLSVETSGSFGPTPETLAARGSLEIRALTLTGSRFLQILAGEMGLGTAVVDGHLTAPDLAIENGVVRYERMELRLEGTTLRFRGKVGLDRSLELEMIAPIRRSWARKLGLDENDPELARRTIAIPIRGTASQPSMDFATPLKELLGEAAGRRVDRAVKEKLIEKLEEKLKGRK
jgi:hypothetical protein